MGLPFRSKTEIKVAEAFDREGVLFFPNCRARLNGTTPPGPQHAARRTYEPDFLVCAGGRWGILEVDGKPYHPPERAEVDEERDRLFQAHGVRFTKRYDAGDCWTDPEGVVRDFLRRLRSG